MLASSDVGCVELIFVRMPEGSVGMVWASNSATESARISALDLALAASCTLEALKTVSKWFCESCLDTEAIEAIAASPF